MKLTKLAVKRPVALLMCVLGVLVLGLNGISNMSMELTPKIEFPMVMVSASYPGASPADVEDEVTSVLEGSLSTVEGLKNIDSNSSENYCSIFMQLDYGMNMDNVTNDIQDKIDSVRDGLPDKVSSPTVMKYSSDNSSIVYLSISSDTYQNLGNYVNDEVVPEFEKISGVAKVEVMGESNKYIKVGLDPQKMEQYGVSFDMLSQVVSLTSLNIPAGSIERDDQTLLLRGQVRYNTVEALKTLPITLTSGNVISLEDVADVTIQDSDKTSISRINGKDSITVLVSKTQDSSTVSVSDNVVDTANKLGESNPNIDVKVIEAAGDYIKSSIRNVALSLIAGAVISMVVLWFFLGDIRASMIVAASMPLSIIATFALMHFAGININLISVGGLVVGVGMIVDNSIVVLESMYRIKSKGLSYIESANEGVRVVGSAIIASTLTTVVVFIPISLIKGMTGQLFRQAGFTIVFSLLASLITAVTIVPALFNRIKPIEKTESKTIQIVKKLEKVYGKIIKWALGHQKTVITITVGLLAASIALIPVVGFELMPQMDQGTISIKVTGKNGLRVEEMDKVVSQIEDIVVELDDVESYSSDSSDGGSGSVSVYLKKKKNMTTDQVSEAIRKQTDSIVGYDITVGSSGMAGASSSGGSVVINLSGKSLTALEDASNMIVDVMEKQEGVVSAKSSTSSGSPEARIVVDPLKAAAYGLNPASVIRGVSNYVQGSSAAEITVGGTKYDVKLEYPKADYSNVEGLSSIMISSPSGISVPLVDVAEIVYDNGPTSISRKNNQYNISVTGQVVEANAFDIQQKVMQELSRMELPEGASLAAGGQNDQMIEEFSAIGNALWLSVVLVFIIMAAQFESTRFSIIVMATVPFSLIGAVASLLIAGKTISMTSFVGIVMLVGMVINNSIVLIDYAGQLRRDCGMSAYDALLEAGHCRLRPILMSTLTTVMGMIPMAIGIGEGSEMMQSMAIVVMGGLICSTMLTLIFIPVVYLRAENKRDKRAEKRRLKKEAKLIASTEA